MAQSQDQEPKQPTFVSLCYCSYLQIKISYAIAISL